jgi:hypothetical protein
MYDPAAQAYREISNESAEQFIDSAKLVDADMTANPEKDKFSMYDPALDVYRELSKADAILFVDSAKDVATELEIAW